MRMTVVTAAVLALTAIGQAKSVSERQVTVYLSNSNIIPAVVSGQAIALASDMFAGIGVTLNFKFGRPSPSEPAPIVIEFGDNTPESLLPGVWAYALPFEGVHIRIFWDRMRFERCPQRLLAHVMVHEITHILQGVARHSAEGIMHDRWTDHERFTLEHRSLGFTAEDVDLIYRGVDARAARRAGQAAGLAPAASNSIQLPVTARYD